MNLTQTAASPSAIEFSADGHYFTAQATDEELDSMIQVIERPLGSHGLFVASAAQGVPAVGDGLLALQALALGRVAGRAA